MTKGYKANRPNYNQTELNYAKSQLKVLENLLERYHRVNAKQDAKGLEPKHDDDKIHRLEVQINEQRHAITQILSYH